MRKVTAMINLEAAVDEMPDEFVIKRFLLQNKAEVKGMFQTEYDQEKVLAQKRRNSMKQGIELANERVATYMLMGFELLEKIVMYSRLAKVGIYIALPGSVCTRACRSSLLSTARGQCVIAYRVQPCTCCQT